MLKEHYIRFKKLIKIQDKLENVNVFLRKNLQSVIQVHEMLCKVRKIYRI